MAKLTLNPAEGIKATTVIAGGSFAGAKDSTEIDGSGFDWALVGVEVNTASVFTTLDVEIRESNTSGTAWASMDTITGGSFQITSSAVAHYDALVDLRKRKRYLKIRATPTGTNWVGSVPVDKVGFRHSGHVTNTYEFSI